jgi:hypothetical protein
MRVRFSRWVAGIALLCSACSNTTMPWSSGSQDEAPGGGGGGGQASSIAVTPASLSFSGMEGGARPADRGAYVTIHGTVYVGVQFLGRRDLERHDLADVELDR